MKTQLPALQTWLAASLLVGGAMACLAAEADDDPNRFNLDLRLGFNLNAHFKNLGGYTSSGQPGPAAGGGVDRTYDDGFVRVDASGNREGLTWFWGYEHASQVAGDTLQLHSGSATADLASRKDGDPQLGFELSYDRRLGKGSWGNWGLEAAFSFTDLLIKDRQGLAGAASLLTDTYALGGIVPPSAPYAGGYAGPGALIGDTPTRTTSLLPGGAQVTGERKLDAALYGFRLGPYVELPIAQRLSFQLGGGLAVGVVDSEFSLAENVTLAGGPSVSHAAKDQKSAVQAGAYADGRFLYRVCSRGSLFAGVQFQYLDDFKQQAGGSEAELKLGETVFVTAGLTFHF